MQGSINVYSVLLSGSALSPPPSSAPSSMASAVRLDVSAVARSLSLGYVTIFHPAGVLLSLTYSDMANWYIPSAKRSPLTNKGLGSTHIVVVLLHGDHPWHVVECDGPKAKVRIIWDLSHFSDEAVEVSRLDTIDRRDEVGGGQTVLVGWRTTTLIYEISINIHTSRRMNRNIPGR